MGFKGRWRKRERGSAMRRGSSGRDGGKRLCYEHKRLRTGHLDTKLSFLGGKEGNRDIIS